MSKLYPIVSVIIPVYNVEKYIAATFNSVVAQTIGIQNIQVIFLDDGSTDTSGEICKRFAETYPANINYIYQENQGVSAARNNGLKHATGKYVNFLDSDDLWSKDALKQMVSFLDVHEEVDFVAAKIKFFDKDIDEHPSNYKFKADRVIDITKEPDNPIFHLPTCLFRREAILDKAFDTRLKITEDAKFLSDVLAVRKAYGVVSKSFYNYRKRQDASSAIGGQVKNRHFYLDVPTLAYDHMMDVWRESDGEVHPFMQYSILSDLRWRIEQSKQSVLSKKEESTYKKHIKKLLDQVGDDVIIHKRQLSLMHRIAFLQLKHGKSYEKKITSKNGVHYFGGEPLADVPSRYVTIDFMRPLDKNALRFKVEGFVSDVIVSNDDQYVFTTAKGTYPLKWVNRVQREVSFLGDVLFDGGAFEAFIEVGDNDVVEAVLVTDATRRTLPIEMGKFSGFSKIKYSYRRHANKLLVHNRRQIKVVPFSAGRAVAFELRFWARIATNIKIGMFREMFGKLLRRNLSQLSMKGKLFQLALPFYVVFEAVVTIPYSLALRLGYWVIKPFKRRPVWIVSDRGMAAGDNGEAFFRYVMSRDDVSADVYFAISKHAKDYPRIAELGKVLYQGSFRFKLKFLLADKIISSHADDEITNPFFRQVDRVVDLYGFDYIFLQHGIIRHDLSGWLNRFNKNIALFVTSAQMEYDSILSCPYYYTKSNVLLSGLPRFDLLENNPREKLVIAPTYRKNEIRMRTNKYGARAYDPQFKHSEYFAFYNNLINDETLLSTLRQTNMTGEFYLHPAFAAQVPDFQSNDTVKVMEYPHNYRKAFEEGSIMVTDYSSVVFDFAYLKKPVIYAQYDHDTVFANQMYEKGDFFSDDKDGFGPVVHHYDKVIVELNKVIKNGGEMAPKYKKRVDDFYYKHDKNNSRRVYEAIIELDNQSQGSRAVKAQLDG